MKAHAIPEGFFRRLRAQEEPPRLLTNDDLDHFPKRAPIGIYDREILCGICEPIFGPWDAYAQQLLLRDASKFSTVQHKARVVGYQTSDWSYKLLKLFFISMVWRASVSSQKFYRKVNLGPWEPRARQMILRADPGKPEDFAVTLARFDEPWGETILDPHPAKKEQGINFQQFYLGGYVAYIKIDRRQTPTPYSSFLLTPRHPLRIIGRSAASSAELRVVQDIMSRPQNRSPSGTRFRK